MHPSLAALRRRCFSVLRSARPHIRKSVSVRCGSGGSVEIESVKSHKPPSQAREPGANARSSLYNVDEFSPTNLLIVHLPPLPQSPSGAKQLLPAFLHDWPVASINYRWKSEPSHAASREDEPLASFDWPTPLHDVAFAYQWVTQALAPPNNGRGGIYVYGSHLGAGLAMSLSLTESHSHKRFSVRGIAAYNGIYNWTTFLPGHEMNRIKTVRDARRALRRANGNLRLESLHQRLMSLFREPCDLFDPFASPSLFFHNPGLSIPQSFYECTEFAGIVRAMQGRKRDAVAASATPRKSYLVFPPRASTLKIPETMLLHDAPSGLPLHKAKSGRTDGASKYRHKGHTFKAQADEIASFMRRSITLFEIKERAKWDEDAHFLTEEPRRRIQVVEVGQERDELDLNELGQQAIVDWLDGGKSG
ncbi:hypothetical protein Trco_002166 [Trichoderma cornu-damae]|uniref:Alpha/beta-hydrolase n=1 Tax=Trichoderma cornu-damae TaxID=654480 RepID=A0A9P8QSA5_9HYPO|nr:hypothetical protein Trco_002166 [Trichoderma cornu-damae]